MSSPVLLVMKDRAKPFVNELFVGGGALFWHLHFAAGLGSAVYRGF